MYASIFLNWNLIDQLNSGGSHMLLLLFLILNQRNESI